MTNSKPIPFSQPVLHHILYVESDAVQIAKYGFFHSEPKSIWLELGSQEEREAIDHRLAVLHKAGRLKLYLVSACQHGDDSDLVALQEQLDCLERIA